MIELQKLDGRQSRLKKSCKIRDSNRLDTKDIPKLQEQFVNKKGKKISLCNFGILTKTYNKLKCITLKSKVDEWLNSEVQYSDESITKPIQYYMGLK